MRIHASALRDPGSTVPIVMGFVVPALGVAAWLATTSVGTDHAGALVAGLCAAGLLAAGLALAPGLVEPRRKRDGVLVIGRRDLSRKLCQDLVGARHLECGSELSFDPHELRRLVQRENIRKIVVAGSDALMRTDLASALLECRLLGVTVEDASDVGQRLHGKVWLDAMNPARMVLSRGFHITPSYLRFKRMMDLACTAILLVLAAPLIALIALAIRLESAGPVLFRQERVGQFGKKFQIYKFRSMRQDAERESGPTWAKANDARVTRIGGFLRRSHLDELPQLLNVLRGELSFVGPRPERPCFVESLRQQIPYFDLRLFVKPGISGWAQVSYRYADSVEGSREKLQYDLWYARHASLRLDVEIMARTALVMVTGRGR